MAGRGGFLCFCRVLSARHGHGTSTPRSGAPVAARRRLSGARPRAAATRRAARHTRRGSAGLRAWAPACRPPARAPPAPSSGTSARRACCARAGDGASRGGRRGAARRCATVRLPRVSRHRQGKPAAAAPPRAGLRPRRQAAPAAAAARAVFTCREAPLPQHLQERDFRKLSGRRLTPPSAAPLRDASARSSHQRAAVRLAVSGAVRGADAAPRGVRKPFRFCDRSRGDAGGLARAASTSEGQAHLGKRARMVGGGAKGLGEGPRFSRGFVEPHEAMP
jgi:hypothetical protein